MKRALVKAREEARRLYLTNEMTSNAEIAARLRVKAHTIGRWRREEDWDGLRRKVDVRAAELFVEKIATDRVTLNVRHYRLWEVIVARLFESLKGTKIPRRERRRRSAPTETSFRSRSYGQRSSGSKNSSERWVERRWRTRSCGRPATK